MDSQLFVTAMTIQDRISNTNNNISSLEFILKHNFDKITVKVNQRKELPTGFVCFYPSYTTPTTVQIDKEVDINEMQLRTFFEQQLEIKRIELKNLEQKFADL